MANIGRAYPSKKWVQVTSSRKWHLAQSYNGETLSDWMMCGVFVGNDVRGLILDNPGSENICKTCATAYRKWFGDDNGESGSQALQPEVP